MEVINTFVGEKYIQYNPGFKDGMDIISNL